MYTMQGVAINSFWSMEPLLGPVSFEGMFANPRNPADGTNALEALDWVIVGGESGTGARPMHPEWALSLRNQCTATGVAFLFKQWGEWAPGEVAGPNDRAIDAAYWFNGKWDIRRVGKAREDDHIDDEPDMFLIGKKAAGRTLDGEIHDGYPV